MLNEIRMKSLKRYFDERGSFTELVRRDWKEFFEEELVQMNLSVSYPGIVRAWHRHLRGQMDNILCLKGAVKICVFDDETKALYEIVSTGADFKIVGVPGKHWHGFKVIGDEPAWLLYFMNRLYDYADPDEEKRPWNDHTIIPASVNGITDDPRTGKPWDWNYPPHK